MQRNTDDILRTLEQAKRRSAGGWIVGILIFAAVLGSGFWYVTLKKAPEITYVTEAATRGPLTVTVTATGTVQPTTQVDVSSELSGTLASVEVDYNDTVTSGQVLARLDDTKLRAQLTNAEASLAAAQAQLSQAQATAREAEETYTTQLKLDERGYSSHSVFIAALAAHDRALAAVALAEADLALAKSNVALMQADLANAVIRSPINGIVLNRSAEAGQIVAAALQAPTLFTLAEDLRQMEVQVDIDEADIGRVMVGNGATFTVDAYSGRNFDAQLVQLRYAPENTNGVVTYKGVLVVNNDDLLLRPGMTATATITVSMVADALRVPSAALRYAPPADSADSSGGGLVGLIMPSLPRASGQFSSRSLWVLRDGAAKEISVVTGASDGRHTEITQGDLAEGDLVIIDQTGA